jgi:predicted O-linked N-acetylglucosamine transferase (SPINDLY family)
MLEEHLKRAGACRDAGDLLGAASCYADVIALDAYYIPAYQELAAMLLEVQCPGDAIEYLKVAVALAPGSADLHNQLGSAWYQVGTLENASACFQAAIELAPEWALPHHNLGIIYQCQGKLQLAVEEYQTAVALKPGMVAAHYNLAVALSATGRPQEAIARYREILQLKANHGDSLFNLAVLLREQGRIEEPLALFEQAARLDISCWEARWHWLLFLPIIYRSVEQVHQFRQRFSQGLQELTEHVARLNPAEEPGLLMAAGCATNFYLQYQGYDDRKLQEEYGRLVRWIIASCFTEEPHDNTPRRDGRLRVGYVSSYLYEHSVGKLFLGWLQHRNSDDFEVHAFHLGLRCDNLTKEFQANSDVFHHLPIAGMLGAGLVQALVYARDIILQQRLDILVYLDIGMNPLTTLLGGMRLSPVQCVTWGHPITSGLPTIDYFLSSEGMEPENGAEHYSEELIRLPGIGVSFAAPRLPSPQKNRADFGLREDVIIYLSCQSLFKYLPQNDHVFAEIARAVPKSQFAFLCGQSSEISAIFAERLRQEFADRGQCFEERCVFVPRLDQAGYWDLNRAADIYLDAIDWSGGVTTLEAVSCGLPIVTLPSQFMRGRHSTAILRCLALRDTIASDKYHYVRIAVRLGLDPKYRQQIVDSMQKNLHRLYDNRIAATALEEFFKEVSPRHPQAE